MDNVLDVQRLWTGWTRRASMVTRLRPCRVPTYLLLQGCTLTVAGLRLKSVVSVLLSGLGTNTDASQMSRTRTRWAHIDNVDAVTAAHTNHATETMRGDEIRGQEHGIKHRKYQDKLDHHVFLLQRRSP